MTAALETLPKGHEFSATTFDLSPQWVDEYVAAVEDAAIGKLGDFVPPMAVAALSVRALLVQAALPAGAIHLAQELAFLRPVARGECLTAFARIVSRGERQGWVLMGVELTVDDRAGSAVMTGRATLTCPLDSEAGLPDAAGSPDGRSANSSEQASSLARVLSQESINRYADASGDHNPLHIDPVFAARTRFGGTIAHGMLLLAYVSEMITARHGQAWLAGGRLKVRFRGAARPGDTVTATSGSVGNANGSAVQELRCINQKGELLISGESETTA